MQKNKDPRMKILVFAGIATVAFVGILIFMNNNENGANDRGTPVFENSVNKYDFGIIPMSKGKVNHIFNISNTGDSDLKISSIFTSCMCTEASLEIDGKRSPDFGMPGHGKNPVFWSEKIAPGKTARLTVIYDPNAHGPDATGPITRTITVVSNSGGKQNTKKSFTIIGEVVK